MDLYKSKYTGEELDSLYVVGTYTGDGNTSQFINLGFTPSAVLVCNKGGYFGDINNLRYFGGLALNGFPTKASDKTIVEIVENGFKVYYDNSSPYVFANITNDSYNPFRYIAFR